MERTPIGSRRRATLRRALPRAVVATLVLAAVWTAAPPTSAPPAGADDSETVAAGAAPTVGAATTAAPEPLAPATTTTTTAVPASAEEPGVGSPMPTPPPATTGLTAAPPAVAPADPGAPSTADAHFAPAPELLVAAADTLVDVTPASPSATFGTPVPDLSVVAAVEGIPTGDPQLDTLACNAVGLMVRDGLIDSPAGTYPLSCTVDAVEGRTVTIRPASLSITPATARVTGLGFSNLVTSVLDPTVDFSITVQTTGGRTRVDRLDLALVFTPEAGPPIRVAVTASPERTFFRDVWTIRTAVELPPARYRFAAELGGNGYWTPSSLRFGSEIEVLRLPNADITPASPTATYGQVVPDLSEVAAVEGIPADDPQLDTLECTAEGLEVRDGRIDSPAGTYPLTCTVDAVDGRTVTFGPAALTVLPATVTFQGAGVEWDENDGTPGGRRVAYADGAVDVVVLLGAAGDSAGDLFRAEVEITATPEDGGEPIRRVVPVVSLDGVLRNLVFALDLAPGTWRLTGTVLPNGYWTGPADELLTSIVVVEAPGTTTTTTTTPSATSTTTVPSSVAPPSAPAPAVEAATVTGRTVTGSTATSGTATAASTPARAAGLAFTGGDLGVLGSVAAALVLAGGLLLLARRRRTD